MSLCQSALFTQAMAERLDKEATVSMIVICLTAYNEAPFVVAMRQPKRARCQTSPIATIKGVSALNVRQPLMLRHGYKWRETHDTRDTGRTGKHVRDPSATDKQVVWPRWLKSRPAPQRPKTRAPSRGELRQLEERN